MPGVVVLEDYKQDGRRYTRRIAGGQVALTSPLNVRYLKPIQNVELGVAAPEDLPSSYKVEAG